MLEFTNSQIQTYREDHMHQTGERTVKKSNETKLDLKYNNKNKTSVCDKSTLKITLINNLVLVCTFGGGTEDFFPLPKVYYGDNTFRYSARSSSSGSYYWNEDSRSASHSK